MCLRDLRIYGINGIYGFGMVWDADLLVRSLQGTA